jgi:hypothetical protein
LNEITAAIEGISAQDAAHILTLIAPGYFAYSTTLARLIVRLAGENRTWG